MDVFSGGVTDYTGLGLIIIVHSIAACSFRPGLDISDEKLLIQRLQKRYAAIGTGGRPVKNSTEATLVKFGLGLIQLDLDERNKLLTTSMWTKYNWQDDYLCWDPDQYGGVKTVRLAISAIWRPDVMLINTANTDIAVRTVPAVINYNGSVNWYPHQHFKSSCAVDVSNFPFDRQTCHMWFGSWTYMKENLDLNLIFPNGIDLTTYHEHYRDSTEWDITGTQATLRYLPPENEEYAVLAFSIKLKRKLMFSSYILTLPCVFLASLTLCVFWLPPDRPDRTALAMSIFSSFLVLLLILVETAPPTASSIPTLGLYYCFNMVIIMLSIFLSSLVVNVDRGGESKKKVPAWLRIVTIKCFGKLFRMTDEFLKSWAKEKEELSRRKQRDYLRKSVCKTTVPLIYNQQHDENLRDSTSIINNEQRSCDCSLRLINEQLRQLRCSIDKISNIHGSGTDVHIESRYITREWQFVGQVLDRFFFAVYILIIAISLVTLFPRPSMA